MAESNEVKYLLVRKKGESERASLVAQMVKHLPASSGDARDVGSILASGRCLGVGNGTPVQWHPAPVFLPGKSHGQRKLAASNPWGRKELDMTEQQTLLNTTDHKINLEHV